MNKIEINIPEGFEIDKKNSDFSQGLIQFKPVEKKKLSYEKIANELFFNKKGYYTNIKGEIFDFEYGNSPKDPNNATSKEQLECLMACNKLRNVAIYLNKEWEPNWNDATQPKYYILYKTICDLIDIESTCGWKKSDVYFASKELAKQALEILGEEEIKKALFIY